MTQILYAATSFWAGTKLPVVAEIYTHARRLTEQHNLRIWLDQIIDIEQNVLTLMGQQDAAVDNIVSNTDKLKANPHASMTRYFQKMCIRLLFREYEQTKALAEKYFSFNLHTWSLLYIHTAHALYGGLTAFWVYRETKDPGWAARGGKAKNAMKKWAESSQHNFQHKAYLLEAEEAYCNNDVASATSFYEKAVSMAKQHR